MFFGMFGLFEAVFPVIFTAIFLTAFIIILVAIFRGVREWNNNNHSPRLTVDARVVSRRMSVTHHAGTQNTMSSTHTTYYVTFQVPSGDRMELQVPGHQYGYMVEGDQGSLTFQGTRFLNFGRM